MSLSDEPDRTRVAIVDDDVWMRTGRAAALAAFNDIEVVVALHPREAIDDVTQLNNADVVLVDAHDPDAGFDRFHGVDVVRHIRAERPGALPVIVVITGHARNDLLRRRMAEAGADFLCAHREVHSPDMLVSTIRTAANAADLVRPTMAMAYRRRLPQSRSRKDVRQR